MHYYYTLLARVSQHVENHVPYHCVHVTILNTSEWKDSKYPKL